MKFASDWRGCFIRGDDAFCYGTALSSLLAGEVNPIDQVNLKALVELLLSVDERNPVSEQQDLRPFDDCLEKSDVQK